MLKQFCLCPYLTQLENPKDNTLQGVVDITTTKDVKYCGVKVCIVGIETMKVRVRRRETFGEDFKTTRVLCKKKFLNSSQNLSIPEVKVSTGNYKVKIVFFHSLQLTNLFFFFLVKDLSPITSWKICCSIYI